MAFHYKDYTIIPMPQLVAVNLPPQDGKVGAIGLHGQGWMPSFVIEKRRNGNEASRTYNPPGIYQTEEEARDKAIQIAKDVIDGKIASMSPP